MPNSSSWSGKADGTPISSVDPELAGELAFNSLWSSASNAAALGGNVLPRLNAFRLADKHARDLWGMGLGDFARQCSRGGADGYDYSGGGYSVGADSGFVHDNNGIWGIAFGQLYGHAKSRGFQGRDAQDTRMGSLYCGPSAGRKQARPLDLQGKPHVGGDAQQNDQPPGRSSGFYGQMEQ